MATKRVMINRVGGNANARIRPILGWLRLTNFTRETYVECAELRTGDLYNFVATGDVAVLAQNFLFPNHIYTIDYEPLISDPDGYDGMIHSFNSLETEN